jgi:predicted glycosyltransferase
MKVWLDFCEPKSITMLRPLYEELIKEHEVFITARDFDSTHFLLKKWGIPFHDAGSYGGGTLIGKLRSYTERLTELLDVVEKEEPDFLFCITSPEAIRVAFGLQMPNIMFNDEPRSYGCSALTLPFVNRVIVPKPIPLEWYLDYGIKEEKIIRFHGIDEVAWLNRDVFHPDPMILKEYGLEEGKYVVCRTEPTKAVYLIDKMKPHETLLTQILPHTISLTKDELVYVVITRNEEQYAYLQTHFKDHVENGIIQVHRGMDNLATIMYFSKMVLTGGGTMVRESALLGVPSIEFFPLQTYPQEQFLIDNGFPLKHTKTVEDTLTVFKEFLSDKRTDTFGRIDDLENPIKIGSEEFNKMVSGLK